MMIEFEAIMLMLIAYVNGVVIGYLLWAPMTPFKQGLTDGLTLKFLWGKK
jgi:hypothetical protein